MRIDNLSTRQRNDNMPHKKLSPSLYLDTQPSLETLKQLQQALESCLEIDDTQNSVHEIIDRLNNSMTDLHYRWIFHEYIRIPQQTCDVFIQNIQPLIDRCLTAHVRIQHHRDDIRQEILLKLLTANPVFPKRSFRGYLSWMVRNGINNFYKRKQHSVINQSLYPQSETCRLLACINEEHITSGLIDYISKKPLPDKKKHFYRYKLSNKGLSRKEIMEKCAIGKTSYDRYSQSLRVLVKQYCDRYLT